MLPCRRFIYCLILCNYELKDINLYLKKIGLAKIKPGQYHEIRYYMNEFLSGGPSNLNSKDLNEKSFNDYIDSSKLSDKIKDFNVDFEAGDFESKITEEKLKEIDCYDFFYYITDDKKIENREKKVISETLERVVDNFSVLNILMPLLTAGADPRLILAIFQENEMDVQLKHVKFFERYFFDIKSMTKNQLLWYIQELNKDTFLDRDALLFSLKCKPKDLVYYLDLAEVDEKDLYSIMSRLAYISLKKAEFYGGLESKSLLNISETITKISDSKSKLKELASSDELFSVLKKISVKSNEVIDGEQSGVEVIKFDSAKIPKLPLGITADKDVLPDAKR